MNGLEGFCERATVYGVNDSVWLVDLDLGIAAHTSESTYNQGDWGSVPLPTKKGFEEFLKDEMWFEDTSLARVRLTRLGRTP